MQHNQLGFITGMQGRVKDEKKINMIYHINRLQEKNIYNQLNKYRETTFNTYSLI